MNRSRKVNRRRRRFLTAGAAALSAGLAGCVGGNGNGEDEPQDDGENGDDTEEENDGELPVALPRVENPPDAVYLPTHREGMVMDEAVLAGDYLVAPMYAVPHRFWLVNGERTDEVMPDGNDDLHLMVSVWDAETGTVLPADAGVTMRVEKDGDVIDERGPWTMISQEMGFHFGDNIALEGDGEYTLSVEVGALEGVERIGELEDRFEEGGQAEFSFEFDDDFMNEIVAGIDYLDESRWGERGALEPMGHGHGDHDGHGHNDGQDGGHGGHDGQEHEGEHGHEEHDHDDDHGHNDGHGNGGNDHGHDEHEAAHPPYSSLPAPDDLPGTLLGTPESGDAVIAATVTDEPRFLEDDADSDADDYILVSPRTPYNACVLPAMLLSAEVVRDGETVEEVDLSETVDAEAGYHYGAPVDGLQEGDEVVVSVVTPPQVSRHQGYETAFLEMPDVDMTVPEGYET